MERFFRAVTAAPEPDDNGRIIRYILSDSSVARDNHTINTAGWDLANYRLNPVFLWAHDTSALPLGRMVDIGASGDRLMGNVEYLTRDEYPFADTVYQLVKRGILNAVSVSWDPLDYKFSTEKGRAGGIDFLRQELLEVSQVPVPCLPSALATARAAGIDTQPMHDWLERALDTGGLTMIKRSELEALRRAAKMPGISNPKNRVAPSAPKRGLYQVCMLASTLDDLGYLTGSAQSESEWEGDKSPVPGMLLDALKQLGAALVAMTQEEVSELLQGLATDDVPLLAGDEAQELYVAAAKTPAQRLLRQLETGLRKAPQRSAADNIKLVENFIRAGRVLSADNEKALRTAHGQLTDAAGVIIGICDAASGSDPEEDLAPGTDAEDTAERARRANARSRQAKARSLVED